MRGPVCSTQPTVPGRPTSSETLREIPPTRRPHLSWHTVAARSSEDSPSRQGACSLEGGSPRQEDNGRWPSRRKPEVVDPILHGDVFDMRRRERGVSSARFDRHTKRSLPTSRPGGRPVRPATLCEWTMTDEILEEVPDRGGRPPPSVEPASRASGRSRAVTSSASPPAGPRSGRPRATAASSGSCEPRNRTASRSDESAPSRDSPSRGAGSATA